MHYCIPSELDIKDLVQSKQAIKQASKQVQSSLNPTHYTCGPHLRHTCTARYYTGINFPAMRASCCHHDRYCIACIFVTGPNRTIADLRDRRKGCRSCRETHALLQSRCRGGPRQCWDVRRVSQGHACKVSHHTPHSMIQPNAPCTHCMHGMCLSHVFTPSIFITPRVLASFPSACCMDLHSHLTPHDPSTAWSSTACSGPPSPPSFHSPSSRR